MLSTAQAKTLVQGGWIYSAMEQNADGSPMRFKVTSIKTWKRKPSDFELRLKHGRNDYRRISSGNTRALACLCITYNEAVVQRMLVDLKYPANTQAYHEILARSQFFNGAESADEVIMSGRQIDIHEADIVGKEGCEEA